MYRHLPPIIIKSIHPKFMKTPLPVAPDETVSARDTRTARARGISLRVVAICIALAFVLGYIMPVIDFKVFNTFLGATHLPPGAIGALLILVLIVNPLMRLVSKRLAFTRNESLTVYISCLFSSLVPGHGAENLIVPVLIAPFYYATRENKWLEFLQPAMKPWMTPSIDPATGLYNQTVVAGWYEGLRPGASIPWGAWLVPLAVWSAAILAIYAMLACLSVMLRAQWAKNEALAFPLLKLPLTMTEDLDRPDKYGTLGHFFRNSMMWSGFGIAVFVQMLRGLHLYFPDVPDFPLGIDTGSLFTEAPWNQLGWVNVQVFPIAVGITYLLTSEIAFSLWFFFLFMKFQMIGAYYTGFTSAALPDAALTFPGKMFQGFQVYGAYLTYTFLVVYTGREHTKHILRRALGRERARAGESDEALSYPVAFWGFLLSFIFLLGFTLLLGVRIDIALALWVSYLVFAIVLSRMAVEGGVLFLLHDIMPLSAINRLLPSSVGWLTGASAGVVPASFVQAGLIYHMRGFTMPSFVHSFKLAHDNKIPARPLLGLISVVTLISLGMSLWMVVRLGYENSGLSLGSDWARGHLSLRPANFVDNVLQDKTTAPLTNWLWLVIGGTLTWGMMLARSRFAWFPFHPIGYLLSLTFAAQMFWFSFFLGWLCKTLITRFGGNDTYRKVMPGFLGLALGDVAMMLFWLAVDGWNGRTGHHLMPF